LADAVLPGDRAGLTAGVVDYARELAADPALAGLLEDKQAARAADEQRGPLDTYRVRELAQMSHDMFDDRQGFAKARHAFLTKRTNAATSEPHLPPRRVPDTERITAPPGRWSALASKIATGSALTFATELAPTAVARLSTC
jgi:putative two-component system hydrogenase maturation factor HypX/HoxX